MVHTMSYLSCRGSASWCPFRSVPRRRRIRIFGHVNVRALQTMPSQGAVGDADPTVSASPCSCLDRRRYRFGRQGDAAWSGREG
jgi:hypothetical protein